MTSIPITRVIPLSHTRYATDTAPKSKVKPTLEYVLKASHQLNYRHVQLMQSKVRCRQPFERRISTGKRTTGVDECVSAACEDSPARGEIEVERWESSPKVITPTLGSPSGKAATYADMDRSQTRRVPCSLSRSPVPERPLSQRARDLGRMFAPLSRKIIPGSVGRRRISAAHFTLEDFYRLAHSRNSSRLESYS